VPIFTSVLEASVLYSSALRDLLLSLAANRLYKPAWSEQIHDEWMRNVIRAHGGSSSIQVHVERTRQRMDTFFPDAVISGFEDLIAGLSLPDPMDRHVLAVAIHAGGALIVTYNLRHFPASELAKYGVDAWHPDEFVQFLLNAELDLALEAIRELRARLQRPAKTQAEYIDMLANRLHMPRTAQILTSHAARFSRVVLRRLRVATIARIRRFIVLS
jgi:predicted nucleic acid-binding protein